LDDFVLSRAAAIERSLVEVMCHPLRARFLAVTGSSPGRSAREIAEMTDTPVRTVRHHLGVLHKAGLIETVEKKPRRGVVEFFYRQAVPALVDDDELAELSAAEKQRIFIVILKTMFASASAAVKSGTLEARSDHGLINWQAEVDLEGWKELVAIHRKAFDEIERVKDESAERLRGGQQQAIFATSALMWFESPRR
jgi:DNA-binding transcriptional ArsR family regulator